MDTDTLYKEAMEALHDFDVLERQSESFELLCECQPITYKELSIYLDAEQNFNSNPLEIMNALRIAQGCGTCFNAAAEFIKLKTEHLRRVNCSNDGIES